MQRQDFIWVTLFSIAFVEILFTFSAFAETTSRHYEGKKIVVIAFSEDSARASTPDKSSPAYQAKVRRELAVRQALDESIALD